MSIRGTTGTISAAGCPQAKASVHGTAEYMAPEQFDPDQHSSLGPRADIWAFGAILVHMLAGAAPFAGSSMAQICSRVAMQRQQPELPRQAEAHPGLAALLRACFSYSPEDRPSAADALQLLRGVMLQAGCQQQPRHLAEVAQPHSVRISGTAWEWLQPSSSGLGLPGLQGSALEPATGGALVTAAAVPAAWQQPHEPANLLSLPPRIIAAILLCLDRRGIASCAVTCRQLQEAAGDDQKLWLPLCMAGWGSCTDVKRWVRMGKAARKAAAQGFGPAVAGTAAAGGELDGPPACPASFR